MRISKTFHGLAVRLSGRPADRSDAEIRGDATGAPTWRLSAKGIKLTATCGNVACSTGTNATAKAGRRSIAFKTTKSKIAAGRKATIVLKPSKKNYRKLAKALRRSKSVKQSTSLKLLKPKPKR